MTVSATDYLSADHFVNAFASSYYEKRPRLQDSQIALDMILPSNTNMMNKRYQTKPLSIGGPQSQSPPMNVKLLQQNEVLVQQLQIVSNSQREILALFEQFAKSFSRVSMKFPDLCRRIRVYQRQKTISQT